MTAAELLTRRDEYRAALGDTSLHLLTVLHDPEPELQQAPVGDVLCWAEGLDETKVSRVLKLAKLAWGKPLSKLTNRDISAICFWIHERHPETWERWKELATGRCAA